MKILVWLKNVQRLSWENNSEKNIRLGSVVVISIFGTCNYWPWPLKDFHIVNPLSYKSLSTHKSNHHRSIKCWFVDPSIFVFFQRKKSPELYITPEPFYVAEPPRFHTTRSFSATRAAVSTTVRVKHLQLQQLCWHGCLKEGMVDGERS